MAEAVYLFNAYLSGCVVRGKSASSGVKKMIAIA